MAADLVPGAPVFIPTLLTSVEYSNVTGGQNVENVKQAGNVVVFVSGQGSRSTLVQAVRSHPSIWRRKDWDPETVTNELPPGPQVHWWRCPSH
jgi:hypothetical protein